MNKGQLIEQLQRQLAEEKAKTKQLEKTVNIISKQKSTAEKELDKTTDENKKLRNLYFFFKRFLQCESNV